MQQDKPDNETSINNKDTPWQFINIQPFTIPNVEQINSPKIVGSNLNNFVNRFIPLSGDNETINDNLEQQSSQMKKI